MEKKKKKKLNERCLSFHIALPNSLLVSMLFPNFNRIQIPSSSIFGSKPCVNRSSSGFSSPSRFSMNSKAFRARGISCDYSCFEIKGVTYRPLGTEIDLLNGISFSVPEKSCCEEDYMHKAAGNGPYMTNHAAGNPAGYHATETAQKDKQTINMQPIAVPAVPVDELRDITDNFGSKTLIGEGSYGRVYHGVLKSGQAAAVKKLDSSKQPDQEYLAQGIA